MPTRPVCVCVYVCVCVCVCVCVDTTLCVHVCVCCVYVLSGSVLIMNYVVKTVLSAVNLYIGNSTGLDSALSLCFVYCGCLKAVCLCDGNTNTVAW